MVPPPTAEPGAPGGPDDPVADIASGVLVRRYGALVLAAVPPASRLWDLPPVVRIQGSALAVWDEIGRGRPRSEVVARLAERFAADPGLVAGDVTALLDDWRSVGLVTWTA